MNIIRDKLFYRQFWNLALALSLQNLLVYGVNLADNLMLGAYSETALAGSALCNQFQFFLQMLVAGAGEGVVVLGSQYWGKGQTEPLRHIIGVALRFGILLSGILTVLALLFPAQLLGLLTSEQAVVNAGVDYLEIVCFTYVIFTVTNVLTTSLRSLGIVYIGYLISATTLCINVCLNTCLIYGNFGFPELGIRGAAIATLTSRCVELLIVCFYLKFREKKLRLNLQKLLRIDVSYVRDYMRVSFPVLMNQAQWGLAQMMQTGILGHLGGGAIAANSIAVLVFQVLSVTAYGAASASGILVGRAIGAGQEGKLRQMVTTLQLLFLAIGLCCGTMIFLVREPIILLYQLSGETEALAKQFMLILAVTTLGTAYQMACDNGIIRGGGDTAFSMRLNLISMWGIIVPFSSVAAFILKLPPAAVFFLLKSDQIYKIVPVALHLHSWKWVKRVTREA